ASSVATVYVDRKDKESGRKTKKEIAERIRKGRSVIIFPEGTTSRGNGTLPYKPGMFFVAAEERFPIIPVAIFYENPDLAWVGDDNMAGHFFRNFSKISTTAHIEFGQPIVGNDGDELMRKVRDWKLKRLNELRETYGRG
ncbi:MAG: 1-acyl-sn-glycerol-3-phosphate acyltransferase, partial [Flavobacteriales bacterium]|nr:1-acyl-sn-glycerol-3-phosphate acyltransferase [Flavobacteriales bacterium]